MIENRFNCYVTRLTCMHVPDLPSQRNGLGTTRITLHVETKDINIGGPYLDVAHVTLITEVVVVFTHLVFWLFHPL